MTTSEPPECVIDSDLRYFWSHFADNESVARLTSWPFQNRAHCGSSICHSNLCACCRTLRFCSLWGFVGTNNLPCSDRNTASSEPNAALAEPSVLFDPVTWLSAKKQACTCYKVDLYVGLKPGTLTQDPQLDIERLLQCKAQGATHAAEKNVGAPLCKCTAPGVLYVGISAPQKTRANASPSEPVHSIHERKKADGHNIVHSWASMFSKRLSIPETWW